MKTTDYTMIVLTAEKGFILTQVEEVELSKRIFTDRVYLAVTESPDNWKEISLEEAAPMQEEQKALKEAAIKALEDEMNNKN